MQITSKNFGNLVVTMVRFHLFPVAMTTAAAAGGLGRGGGMAWLAKFWPAMQGGPLRGIRVHELGAEGDTGPPLQRLQENINSFHHPLIFLSLRNPSGIVWLNTQKKNNCSDC